MGWAQLKRAWQVYRERDGPVGTWGAAALAPLGTLCARWRRFRAGELERASRQRELAPLQAERRGMVARGRDAAPWEPARGCCRELLLVWPAC